MKLHPIRKWGGTVVGRRPKSASINGLGGMRARVSRGMVVIGLVLAQSTLAAAQDEPRTFASPALRTAPVQPVTTASGPVPSEPSQPAAETAGAPAASARAQWPLTSSDLITKRRNALRAATTGKTTEAATPAVSQARWSESEMLIAKARCNSLLAGIEAVYIALEPVRDGDCGTPAPVQLMAIGKSPQIVISPPAIVTCDMVVALHGWLQKDIQPSARRLLGSPIVKIENMSSYSCRNAYGRAKTRLSEHGRANALDIRGFVTAAGHGTDLLADWGATQRDARAAEIAAAKAAAEVRAAALKADAARKPGASGTAAAPPPTPPETASIPGGVGTLIDGIPRPRAFVPQKPAGPEIPPPAAFAPGNRLGGPKTEPTDRKQQFLRDAHTSACRTFKTVLGPEANNAHRNHFHIDMAERASGAYCE